MRRIFITADLQQARPFLNEELACALRVRFVPILLLGACLPSLAQLTQSVPMSDDLSTSAKPGKPYEQIVSGKIPLQPPTRLTKLSPVLFPVQTSSGRLRLDSAVKCTTPSPQADYAGSLNSQQRSSPSQPPDVEERKTSKSACHSESSRSLIDTVGQSHEHPDINSEIYRRNRLDFALDIGWHPVNIPFIYDFAVGDSYNMTPLKYTLVPIIASLRWQVTNVGWPWIFRGNMDFAFSGSITPIPRGPETHYYAFMFGIRRNFVHHNWKAVPFFEQRGGAGMINAKEPLGVLFAQGQNLTFTYSMGAGFRYNVNPKYSFSAGMNYMHISNGYLSEPRFTNYGINVYGPMFGFDMRLSKPHHASR